MLNQTGIKKTSAVTRKVILIAPELAFSLSCKVANTGVAAGEDGKKIVKAGTPLAGNIEARDTAFTVAGAEATPCGILLHDVDPNIVLCLLQVKYKNCSALVNPT